MAEQIEKDAELLIADFTPPASSRRGLRKLAEGEEPPRVDTDTEAMTPGRRIGRIAMYIALVIFAIGLLAPFAWMVLSSLKSANEVFSVPVKWLPETFVWQNYIDIWTESDMLTWIRNTLFLAVVVTFLQVLTGSFAAYGFARMRFRGRDVLFLLYVGTIAVPTLALAQANCSLPFNQTTQNGNFLVLGPGTYRPVFSGTAVIAHARASLASTRQASSHPSHRARPSRLLASDTDRSSAFSAQRPNVSSNSRTTPASATGRRPCSAARRAASAHWGNAAPTAAACSSNTVAHTPSRAITTANATCTIFFEAIRQTPRMTLGSVEVPKVSRARANTAWVSAWNPAATAADGLVRGRPGRRSSPQMHTASSRRKTCPP